MAVFLNKTQAQQGDFGVFSTRKGDYELKMSVQSGLTLRAPHKNRPYDSFPENHTIVPRASE